jgi:nucleotide-binding universal stress UspA family protein
MIQIAKILCPTDYSDASDKAVRYALAFARRVNAHVRFLHVQEPVNIVLKKKSARDASVPAAAADEAIPAGFSSMLMAEKKKGLNADVVVVKGEATTEIIKQAHDWFADLIVMGSHGRSGLMRLMMGSVAEAVFRSAAIPVLLVKQDVVDKALPG